MKRDRRQINAEWEFTNRLGETYRFGRKGSGRNAVIITLAYLGQRVIPDTTDKRKGG